MVGEVGGICSASCSDFTPHYADASSSIVNRFLYIYAFAMLCMKGVPMSLLLTGFILLQLFKLKLDLYEITVIVISSTTYFGF